VTPRSSVILDRAALAAIVQRLGAAVEADHPDGVVLIGVLKGALVFLADLVRAVQHVEVLVDFLAISRFAPNSGRVRIVQDVQLELGGRDVVLVEDLIDTGLTCAYLLQHVQGLGARRVEVCTMLDRPGRRIVPITPRYVGATIADDAFVLGVGLHHHDRYRNLPIVLEADRAALDDDADAFVAWYGALGRSSSERPDSARGAGGTLGE
jgi:hypoxanthine phosphoribosyltransferase